MAVVQEIGTHDDLLARNGAYKRLVENQEIELT